MQRYLIKIINITVHSNQNMIFRKKNNTKGQLSKK